MKKITIIKYDNDNSLVSSILFLIFGIILFTNPSGLLDFVSYIIGGFIILLGIYNILCYYKTLKNLNIEKKSSLISGIILIVLALITMLFNDLIEIFIRLICGGWIIYTGIIRLIEVINNKKDKVSFFVRLVISILLIFCGFYVSLKEDLILSTIGLFIIIYAILEITGFIIYKRK